MRHLLLIFVALISIHSFATELDANFGSITHHIIVRDGVESEFEGGIAFNNRTIYNRIVSLGLIFRDDKPSYKAFRIFSGENSIHKFMLGVSTEWGRQYRNIDYGILFGLYGQNNRLYHLKGIDNFAIKFDDIGLIPLVGAAVHLKYPITHHITLGVSNMITPALTNHSILLRYTMDE